MPFYPTQCNPHAPSWVESCPLWQHCHYEEGLPHERSNSSSIVLIHRELHLTPWSKKKKKDILSHICVHLKMVLLSPDKIHHRTCSLSWCHPRAERRCESKQRSVCRHTSKSSSDINIPQMCEGWSLLTQPQRWMPRGWAGASLISVLERLVHIRVTHSGPGHIKRGTYTFSLTANPALVSPPPPSPHLSLLIGTRRRAGPDCKQMYYQNMHLQPFDPSEC